MLINRFCMLESMKKSTPTQKSQKTIIEASRDLKSRHRCIPNNAFISLHHQRQHHLQRQQRCILLLIALILLQHVEVHTCRQLSHRSSETQSSTNELQLPPFSSSSSFAAIEPKNFDKTISKRAELIHGSGVGQPEEIFTVDDQMESNYDEYPMIVPKRAALLLDRLMVALHHALENERKQQRRIGELNENRKNGNEVGQNEGQKSNDEGAELKEGAPYFDNMYGDDPTVLMDYDFKDLNSINRATGETLMGKSFQRRANIIGGTEGVSMLTSALTSGAVTKGTSNGLMSVAGGGSGGGSTVSGGRVSTGRMYWRCYFNAVTCF